MSTSIYEDLLDSTMEAYSDVSLFFNNPEEYLDHTYRELKFKNPDAIYTEFLKTDGTIYCSITKACMDLMSVNAYAQALTIANTAIEKMNSLSNVLSKEDKDNVTWSIGELKTLILRIMQERDDYTSKRKSIMAKYQDLTK